MMMMMVMMMILEKNDQHSLFEYQTNSHLSVVNFQSRNSVYFNYVDFCSKNGMTPVNAASFGKVGEEKLFGYWPNLSGF